MYAATDTVTVAIATVAANGKVPTASPTDMFLWIPACAGMTSHSDAAATDNDRAAVVGTVATVGDSIGNGAVAAAADTIIDGTVADTGTVKKQNFHTGLDPVSRTKNSAQPTEFDAAVGTVDKERCAQLSSLDTGSSPVWSVVADADATDNDRAAVAGTVATVGGGVGDGAVATVTVTNPDDETIATEGNHLKSSFPRTRESRTNNPAQPTEFAVASDATVVVTVATATATNIN